MTKYQDENKVEKHLQVAQILELSETNEMYLFQLIKQVQFWEMLFDN